MQIARGSLVAIISLIAFATLQAHGAVVGTASIYAPAVIAANNTGSLTLITLTVTNGNGNITVTGPSKVANSTAGSALTAAQYACSYLSVECSNYNFSYHINDPGVNVSGPSAGAAMTLLAVSSLSAKPLNTDFTITGTINSNGTIGLIGGVYDKATAAKSRGLSFIIVPASSGYENELYYLVQTTVGIPLVQASNISQAWYFATAPVNATQHQTRLNSTTGFNLSALSTAGVICSNQCNQQAFSLLTNQTLKLVGTEISAIGSYGISSGVSAQLTSVLSQARTIADRGYLYTAADTAFLDYINAYYFAHHNASINSSLVDIAGVTSQCASLAAPQLNANNYEIVTSGHLRQLWGNYTASTVKAGLNGEQLETDQVLYNIYITGQASGWCSAAHYMYNIGASQSGAPVTFSQSLSDTASSRVNAALAHGIGLYSTTAQQAYKQGDYAAAIIDADYAVTFGSSTNYNGTTQQLLTMAAQLSSNATYGIWATEFSKQSSFYTQQSVLASGNTTRARVFAVQAYSSALLASRMSNDTKLIASQLVQVPYGSSAPAGSILTIQFVSTVYKLVGMLRLVIILLALVLIINLLVLVVLIKAIRVYSKVKNSQTRKARRKR